MNKIHEWLESIDCEGELETLIADASFRKYYRLNNSLHSGIVMDASLQKESVVPFIDISHRLRDAEVRVPKVFTHNIEEGFLLIEDLGNRHLYEHAEDNTFELFYEKAIDTIVKMQRSEVEGLPSYDADFLRFEMELMPEWYLEKYLGMTLDEKSKRILSETIESILSEVLSQPQGIFVHRDFHSRNIMLTRQDEVVVIDYQDARVGAMTYDLVSLLRDVYVELDPNIVEKMALLFRDKKGLDITDETFMKWFDFMGLQRHMKILGIFARLYLRDGKEGYLKDIPLTLKYLTETASKYPQTRDLAGLLKSIVLDPSTN